jgi:hypothetical protein
MEGKKNKQKRVTKLELVRVVIKEIRLTGISPYQYRVIFVQDYNINIGEMFQLIKNRGRGMKETRVVLQKFFP